MSIFKESFPKYVKDQLKIREEIIGGGIKGPNGSVFKGTDMGGGKTYMVENRMDKGGMMGAASIAPLDAGAFFAYQQKTCAIRMCSGANITKKGAEEVLGFTDSYIQNTFGSAFSGINKYEDDYLSRRFILAGGVPRTVEVADSKKVGKIKYDEFLKMDSYNRNKILELVEEKYPRFTFLSSPPIKQLYSFLIKSI